jgi:hypothetical protein
MKSWTALLLVLFGLAPLSARFARPQDVPVERLITNVKAFLAENPDSAEAWYLMGRIYYLGLSRKVESVSVFGEREGLPSIAPYQMGEEGKLAAKAVLPYVIEGRKALAKARELDDGNGLYVLTQTSLEMEYRKLKEGGFFKEEAEAPEPFGEEELAAGFLKAFRLTAEKDAALSNQPLLGLGSLVSFEAGENYLALRPEGEAAKEVAAHLETLRNLPRGPITPLVFSLRRSAVSWEDVIDARKRVRFDLTGLSLDAEYPWPRPDAAFLVWDPKGEGDIKDGTDLFGYFTWAVFWRDGFQPLQMLDDNRDGVLSGAELEGLAAWTDRNGNGRSESGEVTPLSSLGVVSLKTRPDGRDGPHLFCRDGVQDASGNRPLWDWMAVPHAP